MVKKSFNTTPARVQKAQVLVGVLGRDNFSELMNHLIDKAFDSTNLTKLQTQKISPKRNWLT